MRKRDGQPVAFSIESKSDPSGTPQLIYFHEEERALLPDTRKPVLFARDLDGDQFPDTWFYRDPDTGELEDERNPSKRKDGWDIARSILLDRIQVENRWLAEIAVNSLFSSLTLSGDYYQNLQQTILEQELNIRTLEVLVETLQAENPGDPSIGVLLDVISRGYAELSERLLKEEPARLEEAAKVDAAITVATGGAAKGLGLLGQKAAPYLSRGMSRIQAKWAKPKLTASAQALITAEAQMLAKLSPRMAVSTAISQLVSRFQGERIAENSLRRALKASASKFSENTLIQVAKAGATQWRYVGLSMSLQVAAEAFARRKEIYHPNPLVMASHLAQNEEFLQNFAYMSNETFWLTAISSYIQSPIKRIAACALFSVADSGTISYAIRGSLDPKRQALDTGWQAVVGNLQTQLDLAALKGAQNLAQSQSNAKLKLLGYLVVVVDQGTGYFAYAKATEAIRESTPEVHLVPVMQKSEE